MKVSKQWLIVILVLVVALAGIATIRFVRAQQMEQARIELRQREARERKVAVDIIRNVHTVFLTELNKAAGDSTGIDELLATSASKNIDESLKVALKKDTKRLTSMVGCRNRLPDELFIKGFSYERPTKIEKLVYRVPVVWKGEQGNSKNRPSKGYADVNVATRKIVVFDCKEQDAIDTKYDESVTKEKNTEEMKH